MAKYKIAWMPGDGIGNDVMEGARLVLDALKLDAEYIHADIGWEFWCKEGNPLPDRTVEILKDTTCALFGAITSKPNAEAIKELAPELKDKGLVYFSPIVKLRQMFNLHTNLRPCKSYEGNPLNYRGTRKSNPGGGDVDIDLTVFRENTEGSYGGVEFYPLPESVYDALCLNPKMKPWKNKGFENVALSTRIMSEQGCRSIVTQAFEYAKKHNRKSVTLVEKPNVLRETGGLMTRVFHEVAKNYPNIQAWEANIDAICMWMLKNPEDYDVLVAENMFGDIVSDLCAGLVGGLGFAPAANIGDKYAVFEPTHGSAPKYAGQYKVNPIAMLLTSRLMLEWLGEMDMASRLESAIARVIKEGKVKTYDMGGSNTTLEVCEEIAKYV
ncbi:MAG: isocitrate/isopropylmalate dehydrogenase family protein [Phycisphaeraceae bacterium]|nr:isocitrate/isopropylmalate dehydrogenase family protein [Phycisphaerales bacterium]MCB9861390.1 isocitrate/isopropylmalate dehydrogenase family protein [Phycisphaeraceae bacterium]